MDFARAIQATKHAIDARDLPAARSGLEQASALATTEAERVLVHDLGNKIQALIFEVYYHACS